MELGLLIARVIMPLSTFSSHLSHLLFAFVLAGMATACGSEVDEPPASAPAPGASNEASGPSTEASGPSNEKPTPSTPPPAEKDRFPFVVASTEAEAFTYECAGDGTDDRIFLRAFSGQEPSKDGRALVLQMRRDAPLATAIELTPEGPSGVPGFAFDARGREAGGNSIGLFVVGTGSAWPEVTSATLFPQAIPQVDGEPASGRARVRFADGKILDLVVSAPLVTRIDRCGDSDGPS